MFVGQKGDRRRGSWCPVQISFAQLGHPSPSTGRAGCWQFTAVPFIGQLPLTNRAVSPGIAWDIMSLPRPPQPVKDVGIPEFPLPQVKVILWCHSHFRAPCGIRLRLDHSRNHILAGLLPSPFHLPPWWRILVSDSAFRDPSLIQRWSEDTAKRCIVLCVVFNTKQCFVNNGSWHIYFSLHGVFICQLSPKIVPLGGYYFPQIYDEENKAQVGYQAWIIPWTQVLWHPASSSSSLSTSRSDFLSWCTFFSWNLCFVAAESLTLLCHSLLSTAASGSPWIPLDQKTKTKQPIWDIRYHLNVRMLLLWAQAIANLPDQRQTVAVCSAGKAMIFHTKQNKRKSLHIQINNFSEFIFQTR